VDAAGFMNLATAFAEAFRCHEYKEWIPPPQQVEPPLLPSVSSFV
jgi:hypothetical protein